eukprot:superscaffoldBa00001311_g10011
MSPGAWQETGSVATRKERRGEGQENSLERQQGSRLTASCRPGDEEEVENFDVSSLQEEALRNIEADSFWCMSKLLDGIQDNYTFAQPGIQRKVKALEELVSRIDESVHRHMQQYEVEYLQFAFRWMNNLLMRELPLRCTIRLWDTYQAEPEGFSHFHLYVCAAFLVRWRKEILEERDFQTTKWCTKGKESILMKMRGKEEAYREEKIRVAMRGLKEGLE